MAESVYKVIELIGTSTESWEKAAATAVNEAGKSLRDLRIAEVSELDMQLRDGKMAVNGSKMLTNANLNADFPNDFDGYTTCARLNALVNLATMVRNGKGHGRITSTGRTLVPGVSSRMETDSYADYEGLSDPLKRGNPYAPVDWIIL